MKQVRSSVAVYACVTSRVWCRLHIWLIVTGGQTVSSD